MKKNLLDEAKKYCSDFNEAKTNSEGDVLPEEYIFNAVGLIEFVSAIRKIEAINAIGCVLDRSTGKWYKIGYEELYEQFKNEK